MSHMLNMVPINTTNVVANTTVTVPAGHSILQLVLENTTGNSILGGLKVGTTNGGSDVIVALTVSPNSIFAVSDASFLRKAFSSTANTTLYIQAVTLWNSASIDMYFVLRKFTV